MSSTTCRVVALVTRLAALAARAAGREGPLVDAAPFRLIGPRGGAIDPRDEEPAPNPSAFAQRKPTFVRLERATPGVLMPDATLLWEIDGAAQVAVMIEYDRTRRATKQLRRLRRYDWFLAEGWRASRYATLPTEPVVLVVCADERQLRPFAHAADTELRAWVRDDASSLRDDSPHPGRDQVGFTTRERLLTGNWNVLQVPPMPPSERDGSDRDARPIAFTLELDRIGLPVERD
jgi:hypothetical protein